MAQMVLTVVGNAIAPGVGGIIGSVVGGLIDQELFGPGDTRSDAPPLEQTTVSVSADGNPIPDGAGTHPRIARLIWSDEIKENRTEHESEGGKGGGPTHTTTTINPTVTCCYSLGWGPGRPVYVKVNKRIIADYRSGAEAVLAEGVNMTVYDGTQTEPSALAESLFGTGNVSAYRGQILLEFENLPVTTTGNVPPQMLECMVVMDASSEIALESIAVRDTTADALAEQYYDADRGVLYMGWNSDAVSGKDNWVAFDPVSREILHSVETDIGAANYFSGFRIVAHPVVETGTLEYELVVNSRYYMQVYDPDTWALKSTFTHQSGGRSFFTRVGYGVFSQDHSTGTWGYWPSTDGLTEYAQTFDAIPSGYGFPTGRVLIEAGTKIMVALKRTTDNAFCTAIFTPEPVSNGGNWSDPVESSTIDGGVTWSTLNSYSYVAATDSYWIPGTVDFVAGEENVFFEISLSGSLIQVVDLGALGFNTAWGGGAGNPHTRYNASVNKIVFQSSGTVYLFTPSSLKMEIIPITQGSGNWSYYEHRTDTMFGGFINEIAGKAGIAAWRLHSVTEAGVNVSDIITDRSAHVGIAPGYLQLTEITDTVVGVPFPTQASARSQITDILTKIGAIAVGNGEGIRFVKLGGAVARTIDISELAVRTNDDSRTPALPMEKNDDSDIPAILYLRYINDQAEGETTQAISVIETGNFNVRKTLTNRVVMTSEEAATLARILHQRVANGYAYEGIRMLPKHIDLEPGDVITIVDGNDTHRLMMSQLKVSPLMAIEITGATDEPADGFAYGAGGYATGLSSISATSTPALLVFDTSLLRDIDADQAGAYVAAYRVGGVFKSAVVYSSATGETFNTSAIIDQEATVGVVSETPQLIQSIDEWDEQVFTVNLVSGAAPSSVSDAEVLAGANACLYGRPGRWEIIQPATWALVSGSTYTFTHTLRGRRGTDYDSVLHEHAAGDYLVVADATAFRRMVIGATSIGLNYQFKALGPSDTLTSVGTHNLVIQGNALKPYPVMDLATTLNGTDYDITYTARTRRAGLYGGTNGLVDGIPGAQSDAPLSFELDMVSLLTDAVVATKVTGSESYTYSQADRVLDGFEAEEHFRINVYQMNGKLRGNVRSEYTISGDYPTALTAMGGVVGYRFDELTGTVAADYYTANDGTIRGSTTLGAAGMVPGEGTSFNFSELTSDDVLVPDAVNALLIDSAGVSFSCVVDIDAQMLLTTGRPIILFSSTTTVFDVFTNLSNLHFKVRPNGSTAFELIWPSITTGVHHLAFVADIANDEMHMYVDGVQLSDLSAGFPVTTWTHFFPPSGTRENIIADGWRGKIQFPWLFNRALTKTEVVILNSYVP